MIHINQSSRFIGAGLENEHGAMQKFVAGGGPVVNYDWNHDENLRLCMLQAYNQATECRHKKKKSTFALLACLLAQRQSNEKTVAAGRCSSSSIPQNQYKWFSHMKGNI